MLIKPLLCNYINPIGPQFLLIRFCLVEDEIGSAEISEDSSNNTQRYKPPRYSSLHVTLRNIEQVSTEVTYRTCIQEMFHSNLGWDTSYRGLPKSLQANAGIVPRLGHDHFQILFNFSHINHPTVRRSTVYIDY
jgi:hypothetical protein